MASTRALQWRKGRKMWTKRRFLMVSGRFSSPRTQMTSQINEAFFKSSGRRFHAGADVFPPDPGTGPDWAYGLLGVRATMTIELEGHSFCLPAQQIENVGREQWAPWR